MSEAKTDFSAGDKLTAAQTNKIAENANIVFRDDKNAGATINGATLPVPVYQNTTDNEFYACDADDTSALAFVGFATSNSTDGSPIDIQFSGVVSGFSGLAEGEKYYVQDAIGTIGTSKGTATILVGRAISTTELLLLKDTELTFTNGITSKNIGDADTTQNIAHGLGKIPKKVRITLMRSRSTSGGNVIIASYNGTLCSCVYFDYSNGGTQGTSTTIKAFGTNQGLINNGTITFDETNIKIAWVKTNTPTGILNIMWEAEA